MAKAWAAMNAIFFLTSSKSARAWPNWTPVLACCDRGLQAGLGDAPVQLAPKVVRPKSSTVSATRSPLPNAPRMFSFGHGHVVEGQPGRGRAADAALGHAGLDDLEAGHVGRDQKGRDLASPSSRASGVRAITVSTPAMAPLVM